jgi:hypothetical protein
MERNHFFYLLLLCMLSATARPQDWHTKKDSYIQFGMSLVPSAATRTIMSADYRPYGPGPAPYEIAYDDFWMGFHAEMGWRRVRHSIAAQWLTRTNGFFAGGGQNFTLCGVYAYRPITRQHLTVDLHTGLGMGVGAPPEQLPGRKVFPVMPVYATLQVTPGFYKPEKITAWLGVRMGAYLAGKRSFGLLQLHLSLAIPSPKK